VAENFSHDPGMWYPIYVIYLNQQKKVKVNFYSTRLFSVKYKKYPVHNYPQGNFLLEFRQSPAYLESLLLKLLIVY
jgi:hypothetical protein